jgi:uncharacterized protein YprB with RNaseH-like and TPR domain
MGLRSKLSRLELRGLGPVPSEAEPPQPTTRAVLDDLRARIQAVLERAGKKAPSPPPVDTTELPFATTETACGPLHKRVVRLSAAHRTGHAPLLPARDASAEILALLALDPALAGCVPRRALYLDTETTGLHGGTGTVAFLVGLAYWDETEVGDGTAKTGRGGLVVEQLLVRALGEEAPMLERVRDLIARASMLVTFNGKSFDLPLLRTRFVMARLDPPCEPPHLDLLHLARRVHKVRGLECRLTALERSVLGFERKDDVPSGDVSGYYLQFLRTGDARPLLGVIEHNAWDVVAMAALVGLYGEPLGESRLAPGDLVGVAHTLRRAGELTRAHDVATVALDRGADHEALRARAEILKSLGDRTRALADFASLAAAVDDPRVRLELAKLYEHFVKEPEAALEVIARGTSESAALAEKRAARLTKKVARTRKLIF